MLDITIKGGNKGLPEYEKKRKHRKTPATECDCKEKVKSSQNGNFLLDKFLGTD